MSRDLRDPKTLGERLLSTRQARPKRKLHKLADEINPNVAHYNANPSTLEKYGWPQKLPSTLPN